MRIWLDDIRPMPEGYDVWARDAHSAETFVWMHMVTHISFDHDLGEGRTGYYVAKFIEELAADPNEHLPPITWEIHSANPVGRRNIEQAMQSAKRFWDGRDE